MSAALNFKGPALSYFTFHCGMYSLRDWQKVMHCVCEQFVIIVSHQYRLTLYHGTLTTAQNINQVRGLVEVQGQWRETETRHRRQGGRKGQISVGEAPCFPDGPLSLPNADKASPRHFREVG